MAQTINTSSVTNRTDTTNSSTKSFDTLRPHYYTIFQNNCCDSKTNATTATQVKDLLPIPKRFKDEAEEILNLIHGALIENLNGLAEYTSIIPNIFFDTTDTFVIQRYLIDRITLRTMNEAHIINWNTSLKQLYPIRTSGNGNCLLHAVLIAMVGIHDSNLYLRDRLAQFMDENKDLLKNHWRIERLKSDKTYGIRSEESKLNDEWDELCNLVHYENPADGQTATYLQFLEAVHIFSISNMLRRPIIVLAEDVIRNKNGEAISVNDLFGIYLPILSTPQECINDPIILVYDHSHFCPLQTNDSHAEKTLENLLPLYQSINHTYDQTLLPIRFLGDDASVERSNNLLQEYLRIRKIKYDFDATSTPLSIMCAELGAKHLTAKNNFFLLYHEYVTDFFQIQKPMVVEEERKREKQRELDTHIARQISNDNNGWSLTRENTSLSSSNPMTSSQPNTSTFTVQTRNPNNHSSNQRYLYDNAANNEGYIPSSGALYIDKSSTQPQQSNKPPEYAKIAQRDSNTTYDHTNPIKQSNSTNYSDNINNSKNNDKNINTTKINRQENSSGVKRESPRVEIPVHNIQSNLSPSNQKLNTAERHREPAYTCLLCSRVCYEPEYSVYCSECENRMPRVAPPTILSSRSQTRSQPTNIYVSAYSGIQAQVPKTTTNRQMTCLYCKIVNIVPNISRGSRYYCSACHNPMLSSHYY